MLRAHAGQATIAGDIELHAVPDDLARNVASNGSEQPFYCCRSKLTDIAAPYADGMVMMLDSGEAVLGRAVHHGQLADNAGLQQQLDGPVHGSSTDGGQLFADLLSGKPLFFSLEEIDDRSSRSRSAISLVLKDRHQIGTRIERDVHTIGDCYLPRIFTLYSRH